MTDRTPAQRLHGVHAATVCPMRADYAIDEEALARHVAHVAAQGGIAGLLINGHAGENALLTRTETRRVTQIVREAVGYSVFLTSGVNAECSLHAAALARDAEDAGADAVLVFPPNGWALFQDADTAALHHRFVRDACGLPIVLYQAPVRAGAMPYPPARLAALASDPRVVAVKEGSWEVAAYEASRRAVRAVRPDVAMLGSGDEHLLASWMVGADGSQVSLAAIVPELVTALWDAAQAGEWAFARRLHDRVYPLALAIYGTAPGGRATTRLKACLHILGRLQDPTVRPPLLPLPAEEIARLTEALGAAC